mmetsp:Transcript_9903/g.21071  ORF Transcript_9903/g.21071 Transcript_9903/m.21071 type:complete len:266 (-) Transcript_9903:135-932(-)
MFTLLFDSKSTPDTWSTWGPGPLTTTLRTRSKPENWSVAPRKESTVVPNAAAKVPRRSKSDGFSFKKEAKPLTAAAAPIMTPAAMLAVFPAMVTPPLVPLGTTRHVVMRRGTCWMAVPISLAQVSPAQHALWLIYPTNREEANGRERKFKGTSPLPTQYRCASARTVPNPPFAITCLQSRCPPSRNSASMARFAFDLHFVSADDETKNVKRMTAKRKPARHAQNPTIQPDSAPEMESDFFLQPPTANKVGKAKFQTQRAIAPQGM